MTFIHEFAVIRENVKIGKNCIIGPFNVLESGCSIGDNVTIQPHGIIGRNYIIEHNVFIGPHFTCPNNAYIPEGEHGQSENKLPDVEKITTIGEGTRIGARVTLAPGVNIGHHCYIQMNCVILESVPPFTTVRANLTWPDDYDI